MNLDAASVKRIALRAAVALVVLVITFIAYDNLHFHLRSTDPSVSAVPTSASEIRFHFSQPLKEVEEVMIDDRIVSNYTIEGRVLTIPFDTIPASQFESSHTIKISNVASKWFNFSIKSIERKFEPKYIDFNKLSKEEQEQQVEDSNSGQVNDSFIVETQFPIFNERWQIDLVSDGGSGVSNLHVKFFAEVPNYDKDGVITRVSNETAETYRKEVIEYIEDHDGTPEDYVITYDNPYLNEKYGIVNTHN